MHPQQPPKTPIPGIRNIVAVGSGKGGVGKTTVSVNLAIALTKLGRRVGLLDADVYGPNVPLMMNINRPPRASEDRIEPVENYGVKLMSMGFLNPGDKPLIWRGPMLHSAIQQFLRNVDWGELDYLIIDLPPGTGDVALSLAQSTPITGAVVVTTPSEVSLEDARKAVNMFYQVRIPMLGLSRTCTRRGLRPRRWKAHCRKNEPGFSRGTEPQTRRSASAATPANRSPRATRAIRTPLPSWIWPVR